MLGALCAMGLGIVLGSLLDGRDRMLRDELVQRWPVQPAKSTGPAGSVGDPQLRQSGNSAN